MQTLQATSNITVWYPVGKNNFTSEYTFLTNQSFNKLYNITIRQWVNNITDLGKAVNISELKVTVYSLC